MSNGDPSLPEQVGLTPEEMMDLQPTLDFQIVSVVTGDRSLANGVEIPSRKFTVYPGPGTRTSVGFRHLQASLAARFPTHRHWGVSVGTGTEAGSGWSGAEGCTHPVCVLTPNSSGQVPTAFIIEEPVNTSPTVLGQNRPALEGRSYPQGTQYATPVLALSYDASTDGLSLRGHWIHPQQVNDDAADGDRQETLQGSTTSTFPATFQGYGFGQSNLNTRHTIIAEILAGGHSQGGYGPGFEVLSDVVRAFELDFGQDRDDERDDEQVGADRDRSTLIVRGLERALDRAEEA